MKNHDVETLELENVYCKTESSLERLTELLSIPSLQHWSVEHVKLHGGKLKNPWYGWNEQTGRGTINRLTLKYANHHSVSEWVKADVEAFSADFASLHLECKIFCNTQEETKTLCKALALAREWRIKTLHLRNAHWESQGWEVLNNLASKGEEMVIDCVDVFEAAELRKAVLRAAQSGEARSREAACDLL